MPRTATTVWKISPELVVALEEHLGPPVDSYLNGSQTWLVEDADDPELTLEFRLHPVAGYRLPKGTSHYDVWEGIVSQLAAGTDALALRFGQEVRPLTSFWDGLECFSAYGHDVEPPALTAAATAALAVPPDRAGLVDHQLVGDAWEHANGNVSIISLLLEQLTT